MQGRLTAICAGMFAILLTCQTRAADDASDDRAFIQWARRGAISLRTAEAGSGFGDLEPLGSALDGARVVSLGESTHGTREVFQMKHRLLEYLVERKGFTVFAIEASPGGCAAIDAYVHGANANPAELLGELGYWTWDTEEVLALIRWMRAYNDDARHQRKLAFHGFDMQDPEDSLQRVLDFLEPFDPELTARIGADLEPYRTQLYWLLYRPLPDAMRGTLDRATADLKRRLDDGRDELVARSSRRAWEFARRQLVVIEQADEQGRNALKYQPAMGSVAYRKLVDGLPKKAQALSVAVAANDPEAPASIREFLAVLSDRDVPFSKGYREARKQGAPSRRWDALARDLVARLDERRSDWISRASAAGWEESRRAAASVFAAVEAAGQLADLPKERPNVRDRCMAENVAWLLEHEGPDAKVVAWAHNWHVMKPAAAAGYGRMGTNLNRLLGARSFVIGFAFNRGEFQARGLDAGRPGTSVLQPFAVGPAKLGSIDHTLSEVGPPLFALDLRDLRSGGPESTWPSDPRPLRDVPAGFEPSDETTYYIDVNLPRDFDAVVFMEQTSRARPNPSRLTAMASPSEPARDLNLGFDSASPEGAPFGWSTAGTLHGATVAVDDAMARVGRRSLRVSRTRPGQATLVYRTLAAAPFAGRRLTVRGQVRTEGIARGYAGLMVRAENPGEILAMDDTASRLKDKYRQTPDFRGLLGSSDWRPVSVEIVVPADATTVRFGVVHSGNGIAWFDDIAVDVDGASLQGEP